MDRCGWCGKVLDLTKVSWFFGTRFVACSSPCAEKLEAYLTKVG